MRLAIKLVAEKLLYSRRTKFAWRKTYIVNYQQLYIGIVWPRILIGRLYYLSTYQDIVGYSEFHGIAPANE